MELLSCCCHGIVFPVVWQVRMYAGEEITINRSMGSGSQQHKSLEIAAASNRLPVDLCKSLSHRDFKSIVLLKSLQPVPYKNTTLALLVLQLHIEK